MTTVLMFTVLLAVFAFGEWVADKTKAILSTALTVSIVLLVGFWLGLPKDIFQTTAVDVVGMILVSFLITSLGTTMDLRELVRQWKTVIIAIVGVVLGVGLIILISPLYMDRVTGIAGAPIFAGANAAALMMKDALEKAGRPEVFQFCLMLLVMQGFLGIPLASFFLKREARRFIQDPANIKKYETSLEEQQKATGKRKVLQLPDSLSKPSIIFTKLGLVAALAHAISQYATGGAVHPFVVALILGVIFGQLGFLEPNILGKTGSSTFIVFVTTVVIFSNLATVTPQDILALLLPVVLTLLVGAVGVIIGGFIMAKIFKISPYMAIAFGLTCTFGFPSTMFIPQEVSRAVGRNDEEKTAILNYMSPPMLIAGFVTVTVSSVFVAGIVIKMFFA